MGAPQYKSHILNLRGAISLVYNRQPSLSIGPLNQLRKLRKDKMVNCLKQQPNPVRRLYSSKEYDTNEADVIDWYLSKRKSISSRPALARCIMITRDTLELFKSLEPKRPKKKSIIRRLKKTLTRTFSF